ncbi:nucleotide-binding domain-containing protein [Cadophora sp. DSE1049]|nr:nucleotide-binding domain-containing protein [Cadophora sp. DSE1049]
MGPPKAEISSTNQSIVLCFVDYHSSRNNIADNNLHPAIHEDINMNHETIIIVGAGVAGTSTALSTITNYPQDTVYLIDDPRPTINPASKGPGRIVRVAYDDEVYSRLASKSQERIENGHCKSFFHKTERVVLEPGGTGRSRRTFRDITFDELHGIPDEQPAGWIEAANSLEHTIGLAQKGGVRYITGKVVALTVALVSDNRVCTGVRMEDGTEIEATRVLLAMGYKVPEFLESQGMPVEDGLCKTAFVPWGRVELNPEQYERVKDNSIEVIPGIADILPPNKERMLWVNNARTVEVPNIGLVEQDYPLGRHSPYYQETFDLLHWCLTQRKDAPFTESELEDASFTLHYCHDLITDTQDFLIRPVTKCNGLYIACGFSFHGFKFLEGVGEPILWMMKGDKRFSEFQEKWSGKIGGPKVHGEVEPLREYPADEM